MNERFRLNSPLLLQAIADRGLKKGFVAKSIGVSVRTFLRMLNEEHIPEDASVTAKLAAMFGFEERQLLIPRTAKVG